MAAFTFVSSSLLLLYTLVAGESCKNHLSEYGFALVDHMYQSFTAHSLASCYIACNIEPACQSLNYNLADKTCEFNNDTKYYRAKYFVEKTTSVYADNPDSDDGDPLTKSYNTHQFLRFKQVLSAHGLYVDNVYYFSTESPWRKLDSAPVCFGSKGDQFGRFKVEVGGSVEAVKLVHLHGLVRCAGLPSQWSKWGCGTSRLHVFMTTSTNVALLPNNQSSSYEIPGYSSNSPEIVFENLSCPFLVASGQELRLWYFQDLLNFSEEDNEGTSCAYVFAKYI